MYCGAYFLLCSFSVNLRVIEFCLHECLQKVSSKLGNLNICIGWEFLFIAGVGRVQDVLSYLCISLEAGELPVTVRYETAAKGG